MKLIRTKGRGAAQAAQMLAALERRGGTALDSVLPSVRRIVSDVRRRGDRGMLRYATEFDGLAGAEALRVTPQEMAAAWKGLDPALREATEEVGAPPEPHEVLGVYVFEPANDWRYVTSVIRVPRRFGVTANFETAEIRWCTEDEVEQLPLHPGFAAAWPHLWQIARR